MRLREISAREFARRLNAATGHADERFAFFLGAGCSVSSGIPSAGTLVSDYWLPRLRDLRAPDRSDLDAWAAEVIPGYDANRPADFYGPVLEELFLNVPEERQREVESLCDGRLPEYGYATLAQLMAEEGGTFSVVLTTNFDDLVADALFLFTTARPLVITHDSLAGYIRATRSRPLIIKLHGDHRLSPLNTRAETAAVKRDIEDHVRTLLHDRGLVFVGYGGREDGILRMLDTLPPSALPLGVYWVGGRQPPEQMSRWLKSREATWVNVSDFDELTVLLRDEFRLPHPVRQRFDIVFEKYRERYEKISQRIANRPAVNPEAVELKAAAERVDETLPQEWAALREAHRLRYVDPSRAEDICRSALDRFPASASLHRTYGWLLSRHDADRAEASFRKAIEADPTGPYALTAYGLFLKNVRHDVRAAERMYRRAIKADPRNVDTLCSYGFLLLYVRRDPVAAERMYRRAARADPDDGFALANHAGCLWEQGKHLDAENVYRRALRVAPNDATVLALYSRFSQLVRADLASARQLCKRALEVEPGNLMAQMMFGAFMLSQGDTQEGLELLDTLLATEEVQFPHARATAVDALFCIYSNGPARRRPDALMRLKSLLESGVRSPASKLSGVLSRAHTQAHPNVAWLELLHQVVIDDAQIDVLSEWVDWRRNS